MKPGRTSFLKGGICQNSTIQCSLIDSGPQCVLVRRWGVSPETDPSHEPRPLMNLLCLPRLGEWEVHCLVDSAALPIEATFALGFVVGNLECVNT